MNRKEIKRALLVDPRAHTADIDLALLADHGLAAWNRDLLKENAAMSAAFAEVAAPAGLAERVILRARFRQRSRWIGAVAAGFFAAIIGVAVLRPVGPAVPPIALAMLDHIVESVNELNPDEGIAAPVAQASLRLIGIGYNDLGYRIRHIGECVVAGRIGRHLVMNTPEGVVSFLILPAANGEVAETLALHKGSFHAVLRPSASAQHAVGVFAAPAVSRKKMESMMQAMFFTASAEVLVSRRGQGVKPG